MENTERRCPDCKRSLDGGLIYDTFFAKYNDEHTALEVAANFGATKTEGYWDKAIGIYDIDEDAVIGWECPYCGARWDR